MKILVPIDASPQTEYTLEFLASRTTLLGSNPTIELLNVQQPLPARACRPGGSSPLNPLSAGPPPAPAAWSARRRSPVTMKTKPKKSSNPPVSSSRTLP